MSNSFEKRFIPEFGVLQFMGQMHSPGKKIKRDSSQTPKTKRNLGSSCLEPFEEIEKHEHELWQSQSEAGENILQWKKQLDGVFMPNYSEPKCSMRSFGAIKGYSANTNQGITRDYNEDRVSIILNLAKPKHREHEHWPNCSFFAVYDGHGGSFCSDFLRDNLHKLVLESKHFPWNPREALFEGIERAEQVFMEMALGSMGYIETSGSCAIVALVTGEFCHVANVGDSRAVLSMGKGSMVLAVSRDHKPEDPLERERIIAGGGRTYQ